MSGDRHEPKIPHAILDILGLAEGLSRAEVTPFLSIVLDSLNLKACSRPSTSAQVCCPFSELTSVTVFVMITVTRILVLREKEAVGAAASSNVTSTCDQLQ